MELESVEVSEEHPTAAKRETTSTSASKRVVIRFFIFAFLPYSFNLYEISENTELMKPHTCWIR